MLDVAWNLGHADERIIKMNSKSLIKACSNRDF